MIPLSLHLRQVILYTTPGIESLSFPSRHSFVFSLIGFVNEEIWNGVLNDRLNVFSGNILSNNYVGETGRNLKERIKEHIAPIKDSLDYDKKKNTASMFQIHSFSKHNNLKIEDLEIDIIGIERRTQARKVLEAVTIKDIKPTLNANSGLTLVY
jgi:GIY-YIG catalytic domain